MIAVEDAVRAELEESASKASVFLGGLVGREKSGIVFLLVVSAMGRRSVVLGNS
ncbi:hypothetical protein PROAA_130022 [Candidatus Propionivibrio aalborgensis]|uniref:Uncharacterized protein n=1 Tax=Candidatus Propionivibrio aalborgensis TaxID=1860101 RepID=A0A1A8XJD6_9RHOO|nr:hypothetical protein PROAA_130022 [Candidatus Propionivibrio aalborgensis]